MKVAHVLPRIITESSGPAYSVPRLCEALAMQGAEVELHLVGEKPSSIGSNVKVFSYPADRITRFACGSRAMRRGLREAAQRVDIMHNHSLWLLPNVYPAEAVAMAPTCRLVVSPRGTFSEWAMERSQWKKQLMWRLGQRRTCANADMFHATAEMEVADIRRMGLSQLVTLIPNGVDLPDAGSLQRTRSNEVLFLSRIHPKKGVECLLRAWADIEQRHPEWRLTIAGPLDGDYPMQMKAMAEDLQLLRVEFPGELKGEAKARAYRRACLFVLPTRSENFGLVVAEALASATPAIVTRGAPWEGLEREGCGWWINDGVESLTNALSEAMETNDESLAQMGAKGRAWMDREFSWHSIGEKMLESYRFLDGGGKRPLCVREYDGE